MSVTRLTLANPTVLLVPRTATPTTPPQTNDEGVDCGEFSRLRGLIRYFDTVTACNVRLWVYDAVFGDWVAGASTDDLDPLNPTATPVDASEGREWVIGIGQQAMLQVEKLEGGGEVEIYGRGITEQRR